MCFAGHADVVPVGDVSKWKYDPFLGQIQDGIIYGRGAVDMKGAIAAFIHAVNKIKASEDLNVFKKHKAISLLITCDEEGDAINGTKPMLEWLDVKREKINMCIIGEPVSDAKVGDTIKIGARGSANFKLTVYGKQGHVAYNQFTCNPIPELAALIQHLYNHKIDRGSRLFEPSNLEFTSLGTSDSAENVIPYSAHAYFNVRFGEAHTAFSIKKELQKICEYFNIRFDLKCLSSSETFVSQHELVSQLASDSVAKVCGYTPCINTKGGTSDGRFIHQYCPVIELGLLSATAHQIDEHVSIEDLEKLSLIYQDIINTFLFGIDKKA